jgi:UPF0755 protein
MYKLKSLLYKLTAVTITVGSLGVGWLWMDYQQFSTTPIAVDETGARFELQKGETLTQLSKRLHQQGLIGKPLYWVWGARIAGEANKVQAGEYEIVPGDTPDTVLAKINTGKTVQYTATLIEGLTFAEMLSELHENPYLQHTLQGKKPKEIMKIIGHPGEHPEGRFLPDTYHFPRGTTDVAFLKRAYDAMETFLAQAWENRKVGLPYKKPYDALIMASIVEKETGLASERPAIAGVFVRRLEKRMRLQTDPTVIYGMGEKFDGNLRRRDLKRDNPYNTYRHRGLPPTPIAMPGREAIQAALNPEEGDALYFVSRGDGSHEFTSTLKEHNRAVIKYQLGGKPRRFSSMPQVSK